MLQKLTIGLAQVKAGNTSEFPKRNKKNHVFFVSSKKNY